MLGLVQDEPNEKDRVEDVEGLRFVLDGALVGHLQRFFPLAVEYEDRYWHGLRVRPSRQASSCC